MDLINRIRPVDRVLSAFNLALAFLWVGAVGRAPFAPWLIAAHVGAACLPALIARLRIDPALPVRLLRELYPLVLVIAAWSEMGLVRDVLHAASNDALVSAADRALFGTHLHTVWMPAMPATWFSELMFFVYWVYYLVVFATPVILLLVGRREAARDVVFALVVGYLSCYVLYAVFPVDGPSHTMARYAGALTDGFFYRLAMGTVHAGDSAGTAFPSSHVVGAVTMALLAARWFPRPVAVLFAIEAAGVVLATVYTQNHFAIDSVAGLGLAVVLQRVGAPALAATLSGERAADIVPPLPVWTSAPGAEPATGGAA